MAYPAQLALAKKIPGVQKIESSKVWPKEDGCPTPAHRLLDLCFVDYDAASEAVTTAEAGAFLPGVFEIATAESGSSSPTSRRTKLALTVVTRRGFRLGVPGQAGGRVIMAANALS